MSKRRREDDTGELLTHLIPTITEAQIETLKNASSSLPEQFSFLAPICQRILAQYDETTPPHRRPLKTRPATDFKHVKEVATLMGIDHKITSADYVLFLKESNQVVKTLSPHYDAVIKDLMDSPYIPDRTNESFSRTIIDLILLDRLNALRDETSHRKLLLGAEVTIAIQVMDNGKPTVVQGRADWAIGYGNSTETTGNLLIVAEAKRVGQAVVGMPQLIIYMAAAQEARKDRVNQTVWGILSDAHNFFFLCLNNDRKLLTSPMLEWRYQSSQILNHLDTLLRDAIQSSPHTTPQKQQNSTLRSYGKYLAGSWHIGVKTGDEEAEEDEEDAPVVDVVMRNDQISHESANDDAGIKRLEAIGQRFLMTDAHIRRLPIRRMMAWRFGGVYVGN